MLLKRLSRIPVREYETPGMKYIVITSVVVVDIDGGVVERATC